MESKYYLWLLVLSLALHSCFNHKDNKPVASKVIMPENMEIYNPFLADSSIRNLANQHKQFKFYALVDVSCSTCLLKLSKWDSIQLKHPNIAIMPICYAQDNFEQLKFLFENDKIPRIQIPLFLDLKDSFIKENKLLAASRDFAVLTDGEDRVLLSGSPISNDIIKEKFGRIVHGIQ